MSWPRWFLNQVLRFGFAFLRRWHQRRVLQVFKRDPEKGRHHMKRTFHWHKKIRDLETVRPEPAPPLVRPSL